MNKEMNKLIKKITSNFRCNFSYKSMPFYADVEGDNYYILNEDGETIGVVGFEEKYLDRPDEIYISYLEIYNEYRGRKLFKKFIETVERIARDNGYDYISLSADISGTEENYQFLKSLYERYGYKGGNKDNIGNEKLGYEAGYMKEI